MLVVSGHANAWPGRQAGEQFVGRARGQAAPEPCVFLGDCNTVELLLQYNADINAKGRYGLTALLMAIQQGKQGIVELLLQNNADVNAKSDYDGSTPLIMAARYGQLEIVELLLQKNADVNAKTSDGSTALALAAKNKIVRLILNLNFLAFLIGRSRIQTCM